MKKKLTIFIISTTLFNSTFIAVANAQPYHTIDLAAPSKNPFSTQVGAALEERNVFTDGYLFFNQTIDKAIFYELRGYFVRNYIVTPPPSKAVPVPSIKNEQNLNGIGAIGILGYIFPIVNDKFSFMPFLRLQYFNNTSSAYKDSIGNEIKSHVGTYLLGLKLNMTINEAISAYLAYYAGYQRSILKGRGYFNTSTDPILNQLTSTYELGFPYKITHSWTISPYLQWITTATNPNNVALNAPISNNGLTSTTAVYAIRLSVIVS